MKLLALVFTVVFIAWANCQPNYTTETEYVEKLWAKISEFFVSIPGENITISNFNSTLGTCCHKYNVSFKNGWFWMSDIASNHKLDKTSIKSEVDGVNSTIKFNVDLKGCQIGWSGYLYKEDNLTSDLSCSFDLDRIPYEFAVTKNTKTNHVEATFKFAGMHSSRLVILASTYLPPNTQFAKLLKKAMDQDMKFRESMGDVFASITQQGQAHVNKALPMVDFPENL